MPVGLIALQRLTASDRSAIEALAALCRAHDPGLTLPLYYGESGPALPAARDINHFAVYQGGALIGLAELTPGAEVEVQCVVHPAHRRRGVGRALVGAVQGSVCGEGHRTARSLASPPLHLDRPLRRRWALPITLPSTA